jgi:hypothetical protein
MIGNPDNTNVGDEPLVDGFGSAVAVDAGHLVVGMPHDRQRCTGIYQCSSSGAVFVRQQPNGDWTKLMPPSGGNELKSAHFGATVALDGDLLAVGAPGYDSGAGAVFLYRRVAGAWIPEEEWTSQGGHFGDALSLDGERLAVGAPTEPGGTNSLGGVHLFASPSPGVWVEEAWLVPADDVQITYGEAVVLDGATLAVGAPSMNGDDRLYVYDARPGAPQGFSPAFVLDLPTPSTSEQRGASLALSGATIAVGAPGKNGDEGAVYVLNAE